MIKPDPLAPLWHTRGSGGRMAADGTEVEPLDEQAVADAIEDLVFNDGYHDLIEVTIPEGSVLRPQFPAPLGNRLSLMARQFDVVDATFSKALEQFAVTGGYGTSPNFVHSGTDEGGNPYQILAILYGGIPARPFADGLDGHLWWPLFKAVPTEYLEKYYPLRVHRYAARIDSGGAGYHRGGHGVAKTYEFLADGVIFYQDDRAQTFPWSRRGEIDTAATEQAREQARDGVDRSDEFDFGPVPDTAQLAQRIADERRDFDAWMAAESRA